MSNKHLSTHPDFWSTPVAQEEMCFPQQGCPAGYMNPLHDGLYISSGKYKCSYGCPGKIIGTDCQCACVIAATCGQPVDNILSFEALAHKLDGVRLDGTQVFSITATINTN